MQILTAWDIISHNHFVLFYCYMLQISNLIDTLMQCDVTRVICMWNKVEYQRDKDSTKR